MNSNYLTKYCVDRPKPALIVICIVTVLLASGIPQLRSEFGFRVLIGDEHPSIIALDEFIQSFGGGLPVQIAWECGINHSCASVFDRASLEMASELTRELEQAEGILSVWGPSNAPVFVPSNDGFDVEQFGRGGATNIDILAERVRSDPFWLNQFVSENERIGVIVVQPVDTRSATDVQVVNAIEEGIRPYQDLGFDFHVVGASSGSVQTGRVLNRSTSRIIPFTVMVVAGVLLFLSRSVPQTAVALITMGSALLWTFGIMGWLGWPRDGIHEVLAPLILVVGVCDALHLLARRSAEIHANGGKTHADRRRAMLAASRDVIYPCLVTSATTALAFLSFTTSELSSFNRFGVISAVGVTICLLLTFTLLPVLAGMIPMRHAVVDSSSRSWDVALESILRTSEKRAVSILVLTSLLFAFFGVGWFAHLRIDMDWYESFGEDSFPMESTRFLQEHLNKSETLEIQLTLPERVDLEDPAVLKFVGALSQSISSVAGVVGSTSVVDLVERASRLLNDDDPAFEKIADTSEENAQILEMIAMNSSGMLRNWVSLNRNQIRISFQTEELSHLEVGELLDQVNAILDSMLEPGWLALLSGETAMNYDWVRDVQGTQTRSFPAAFLLVFILVAVFLRSLRLAAIAMIPTLLPVVVTLGAMGWLGMSLDVGRAMIAAVLLGIGVDDAIHIMDYYRRRIDAHDDPVQAIGASIRHSGRAIVSTSLALSLGFLTLMASAWQTISSFGFFLSIAILGALVASLFVLPALIVVSARAARA